MVDSVDEGSGSGRSDGVASMEFEQQLCVAPDLLDEWFVCPQEDLLDGLVRLDAGGIPSTCTVISGFEGHFSPSAGQCYFRGQLPELEQEGSYWVNVVVTAYNEIGQDLEDTLASLEAQAENLAEGCKMHVLVVFDGWWKVAPCMKRKLWRLFPGSPADRNQVARRGSEDKQEAPSWMKELDQIRTDRVETFVVQEIESGSNGRLAPVGFRADPAIHVSAIIKLDNRRKHNSHEWYLRAFAASYPSCYLYFTDVGTTADPYCIPRLTAYMDANQDYVATTGFQRVLSRPGAGFVQRLHAEIQSYELGPGMCATIKAAQACIGFQMILCGPCTMVRSTGATPRVLDAFFEMMNKDPAAGGVMLANLQLTEDMAFGCYLYALSDNSCSKTGYVPDAFFNYDVETMPEKYLKQRRRWMNGIVAGMNHLIFQLFVKHLHKPFIDRLLLFAVFVFQYHFAMQFLILPAFYMCATYSMLGGFTKPTEEALFYVHTLKPATPWAPLAGAVGLWLFLAAWVVVHHRTAYVGWLYHIALFVVMVGGGFLGGGAMVVWRISPKGHFLHNYDEPTFWGTGVSVAGLTACAVPILCAAICADLRGLRVSIINSLLQLWFMPMYCLTGGYSMARFSDFTWGNRPHQSEGTDGARRDACMKRCRATGRLVAAGYLAANALGGAGLILLGHYRPLGVDPFVIAATVIVFPVALSSICGFLFTSQYIAKYRWLPAVRTAVSRGWQVARGGAAIRSPASQPLLADNVISDEEAGRRR